MGNSEIIIGLVVLMVLGVIMISIVIPTTQTGITTSQYAGTVSNELFTGVAATPSTLTKYVASVLSFEKSTAANAQNATALATATGTRNLVLTTPNTGVNRTITIVSNIESTPTENVSWQLNGGAWYRLSSNTETWTAVGTSLLDGANVINFTNNGTTTAITKVNITYSSWVANTAYTVANGKITPTASADYRVGYYYASTGTNAAFVLLDIIPLLLAVMLVLIVIGFWKIVGG